MDQRRSSDRGRTFLTGRIVFNNRFSLIDRVVRDLSSGGARISFEHPIDIPDEFELEVPKKELSARVRVAWSNGKEHGVTFISDPAGARGPGRELPAEASWTPASDAARREVSGALTSLLADHLALSVRTRAFLWHADGADSHALRALLDTQSTAILKATDGLAERARSIGGTALRSLEQASRLSQIDESDAAFASPGIMRDSLCEANTALCDRLRAARAICNLHSDIASAILVNSLAEQADERLAALLRLRPAGRH